MATHSQFRCAVDGPEALAALRSAPLPFGLRAGPPERSFHRDIYLDTSDQSLAQRGIACRLRVQADDRRYLCLIAGGDDQPPQRWEAEIPDLDLRRALEGDAEPARRLRGLVDPALLRPRIEVETERWTRLARSGWLVRRPRFAFLYDACTVRQGGLARTFEELQVRRLAPGGPHLDQIAQTLERVHGLRPLVAPKHERAARQIEAMAAESTARMLASQRAVALIALEPAGMAFQREGTTLAIPTARGSGEEACRHLLRRLFGSGVGELSLLGHVTPTADRASLEVWVARKMRGRTGHPEVELEWLTLPEALAKVGTPELRSPESLGALALAARADLAPEPAGGPRDAHPAAAPGEGRRPVPRAARPPTHVQSDAPAEHYLNVELSQLAFQERVLEIAEDPRTPLAERLRYLAIVSGNLDEFFSVRVGALKTAIAAGSTRRTFDGLSPTEQLDAVAARVPPLVERAGRALDECLRLLAGRGVRIRRWESLDPGARQALTRHFTSELLPVITPRAVTLSPGYPFPVIPHLTLAFAVLVRDVHTGPIHFAYLPIPSRIARFIEVPGTGDLVAVEELVRANLQAFYPGRPLEQAWLFRVTRRADLDVNEEDAGDLLQAIEEEVGRRALNAPVRLEMQRGMPATVRDFLIRELRFERRGLAVPLGDADVYEIPHLLDLTCLHKVAERTPAADSYPPFVGRRPIPPEPPLFEQLERGDVLVHHPFDDFDSTVGRFLYEAAQDPAVVAIKLMLYRAGDASPIVDALVNAARQGKDVAVFVELKARFDEARNVRAVRQLEEAGAQVVYGLVGLKTHGKCALVVRETTGGVRRYSHVGTGNYNPTTAKVYTDLGLLTADPEIGADLGDLFNQLTGTSTAPIGEFRRILVSPAALVPALLRRIEREAELARAGQGGRIRIQVNGLEDPEMIGAFYRASEAGVEIDLVVRGLCLLRPGVPGLSERIRVTSVLGRFLEHQRIFHFGNGGGDEYLIGSADLRPRNLRRRVEVLVPVRSPALQARLGRLLTALLEEPAAWTLDGEGRYTRPALRDPVPPHVHARLLETSAGAVP
jgi:polyphosphate kinase